MRYALEGRTTETLSRIASRMRGFLAGVETMLPRETRLAPGLVKRETVNRPTVYSFSCELAGEADIHDVMHELPREPCNLVFHYRLCSTGVTRTERIPLYFRETAREEPEVASLVFASGGLKLQVTVGALQKRDWDSFSRGLIRVLRYAQEHRRVRF